MTEHGRTDLNRRPGQEDDRRAIVVGIDGSPGSVRALEWSMDEARLRRVPVRVVNAWQFPGLYPYPSSDLITSEQFETESRDLVTHAVKEAMGGRDPDIEVINEPRMGLPATVLVHAAENASLLVIGSRGRGGFAGLLLGSVSQQCVHHAPCPVVVIPPAGA